MGVSRSPLEYTAKMTRAAELSEAVAADATRAGADLTKRIILAGTPARMRHVGKNGSPLGVRYTGGTYGEETKYLIFAVGRGWPILERDTGAHAIPRLKGQRAGLYGPAFGGINTRRKKPLKIGDGFAMHVRHPGTKGKHTFEKGVDRAYALMPLQYAARQGAAYRTVF